MTLFTRKNLTRFFILLLILIVSLGCYHLSTKPIVLRKIFSEKIWVHRVNSLLKQDEVINDYEGVELDIVWTGKGFDVNHPPAKSIGLSLEEFLENTHGFKNKGVWLDYKNLDVTNYKVSAQYLDSLITSIGISRKQIYVESKSPEYLVPFIKYNFKTSYYLPSGLRILPQDSIPSMVSSIKENVSYSSEIYLSAPFWDYQFMKEHFPERKKLLWYLGGLDNVKTKYAFYKTLMDPQVKVVLRPYRSIEGDR
jgi:hypothetical protein